MAEVKAQMGAVKIGVLMRIKKTIDPRWAILEWMIPHSAELINRFLVGADGKTAHRRIYGKHFIGTVFEMGEQVWAKPTRASNWAKMGRNPKRKMSLKTNWLEGTWSALKPIPTSTSCWSPEADLH